ENIARDPGNPAKTPKTPGRSRWPEADKLRHLTKKFGHKARYLKGEPIWPRAGFGLPVGMRFRDADEPPNVQLNWIDNENKVQERLASPLILKPLATRDGFLPCALWLHRAYPRG